MLDSETLDYVSKLEIETILNNNKTATRFKSTISDDQLFNKVEDDLMHLDQHLKKRDQYLLITFDRLDQVVKPKYWNQGIAPLIKYCQSNSFKRILPKLFMNMLIVMQLYFQWEFLQLLVKKK